MKKVFAYVLVLAMFAVPLLSYAAEFRAGEQASIGKNEKIVNDVYIAGGSVTSAGGVTGDLVTAGGNVLISGDVGADLIVGGGNVTILSNVGDDLRAGGGTVILNGKVGGDAIVGGGQVTVGGPGIGGDLVIGGGMILVNAPVDGNLTAGGGSVYINAPIKGDVKIEAEKVTLGSGAVISGNLTYKSTKELIKEDGAVVKGKIDFEQKVSKKMDISPAVFVALFGAIALWKFFALLASALVVGLLLKRYNKEIIRFATERPLFELGMGVVVMIVVPIISIFFFVTLVGIPFGVISLLGFAILMLFAWIITPIILGSVVYKYFTKREYEVSWKTIILGVLLYCVLGLVPFFGSLAQTLLMWITLGSMCAFKMKVIKEWR